MTTSGGSTCVMKPRAAAPDAGQDGGRTERPSRSGSTVSAGFIGFPP